VVCVNSEERTSIGVNAALSRRLLKVTVNLNFVPASGASFPITRASLHEFLRELDRVAMDAEEDLLPYQIDAIAKISNCLQRLKYAFRLLVHNPGDWAKFPWRER
jgi:hypothetical protein